MRPLLIVALCAPLAAAAANAPSPAPAEAPRGNPAAIVDLATADGARLVGARWRWRDARVIEVESRGPGPDLRPSGARVRTLDTAPRPGQPEFDDARAWTPVEPEALAARRGRGKLSFGWYRVDVTVPARIAGFDPAGSTLAFEVVVDDYAEVWVNGRLPRVLGEAGGHVVKGFGAPNRVVLGRDVRAGQRFSVAVFAMNGPISASPDNFIWVKSATLDFHRPAAPLTADERGEFGRVIRLDPGLERVVSSQAKVEKLADGFQFTEGPVWHPDGYLLFSDPNANTIYRWDPAGEASVYRVKSGYSGVDVGEYRQPGSNGLTLDAEGRLTVNEHGNRRVTRTERNGSITVLADRYEGKRLNSPNDLVYRSDGTLFFTDPPFGLPKTFDDPRRELPPAVYRLRNGELKQVSTELRGPNGVALSPDERFLYVANWDEQRKVVMRYDVAVDGTLANGHVFHDASDAAPADEALDGVKVDEAGHVFVSAPDGVRVLAPDGRHLGTLVVRERPANMAFGDDHGRTLYLAGRTSLYRIRLEIPGVRPQARERQQVVRSVP
jgi:gluconolactonase